MADEDIKDVNHIAPFENFVQEGLDYIPSEVFKDGSNFNTLISLFLRRLQEIDEKLVGLAEKRTLLNAVGSNLDELGNQLGIYRNGLEDPEYRAVIMIMTGSNTKSGTRQDIISILKQLFGDEGVTTYKGFNYRMDINIFNTCVSVRDILSQMLDILPLVTHLRVVESNGYPFAFYGDEQSIGFSSVGDDNRWGAGGCSSLTYTSDEENN